MRSTRRDGPRATVVDLDVGIGGAREGTLGAEPANELFEPPGDTRTSFERNDYVIEIGLVLATIVVAAAGVLALRPREADAADS